jgi:hypothetical protein
MDHLTYWTEKLRQAERELDAARTRTAVNDAAKRYQQAKAELKGSSRSSVREAEATYYPWPGVGGASS